MRLKTEEPMPAKNDERAIWDLVIDDMKQRDEIGQERYKTRLQPFNGRNSLNDLFQELLDAVAYVRQSIVERQEMIDTLKLYTKADKISCDICGTSNRKAEELLKKLGEL